MKKVIITLLCIAILGGGGYAGAMKYKKNQDKKTVVAVVPVDLWRKLRIVTSGTAQRTWMGR